MAVGHGHLLQPGRWLGFRQSGDDFSHAPQGITIVRRQMVRDTGNPGVHGSTTEFFRGNVLARCGFHQWWSGEEDGALVFNDDGFIAHGGDICAPAVQEPMTAESCGIPLADILAWLKRCARSDRDPGKPHLG